MRAFTRISGAGETEASSKVGARNPAAANGKPRGGRASEQALGDANKLRAGALLSNPTHCKIFAGCDSFQILRMGHNICTFTQTLRSVRVVGCFLQMKLEDFFRQRRLRLKMLISRKTKINGGATDANVGPASSTPDFYREEEK